mmetsp:Transcript_16768/g.11979  ORF Transcript_16768/g.11979 Transcript_16768/m.11979 type:complete len:134 (-) Transcript_16768:310-711(-)|eukprot:CAMPEP_0202980618 /NCGR_PEP_ID=MMETSP1396-20130829/86511_1 /ASSEMBLY_ACC=CAM_ASM_000872 /TAXON_ID= /ORGANISM="Pseudokeronopsis sp., Strain Brazil" /LENGTH=133 /DNA_ID=CAMNT_0049720709 /DNA_START=480 /DNA_END=881 /DNA_ORIENTATION=+
MPHIVISSIFPPGGLYSNPPRKTPDVFVFTDFNWDSPWNSLIFEEDLVNYTGLPANETLAYLIDVKGVKITNNGELKLVDIGWTYMDIYSLLENENNTYSIYTNSGLTAIPLFQGSVRRDVLAYALKSDRAYD